MIFVSLVVDQNEVKTQNIIFFILSKFEMQGGMKFHELQIVDL